MSIIKGFYTVFHLRPKGIFINSMQPMTCLWLITYQIVYDLDHPNSGNSFLVSCIEHKTENLVLIINYCKNLDTANNFDTGHKQISSCSYHLLLLL